MLIKRRGQIFDVFFGNGWDNHVEVQKQVQTSPSGKRGTIKVLHGAEVPPAVFSEIVRRIYK